MRVLASVLLAVALLQDPARPAQEIHGRVLDPMGAVIARAGIRVLDAGTRATVARTQSDAEGNFTVRGLLPGAYALAVAANGFAEKLVKPLANGDTVVTLNVLDCDAPGVNCDIITSGPYTDPHPVLSAKDMALSLTNGIDLEKAAIVAANSRDADVSLVRQDNGLYVTPAGLAALAQQGEAGACKVPRAKLGPVRVDGLGPGSEIVLRTRHHRCARLYVTSHIDPGADQIQFHVVTRR